MMKPRHVELFLAILPAILHDALAEVRAQSRKCFWAFQRVFPVRVKIIREHDLCLCIIYGLCLI